MAVTFTDGTTSGVSTKDIVPSMGVKMIQVTVPADFVWGTDIIVVDLKDYGASLLTGFLAFEETTAGQVIVAGTGTTSNASGVVTFTSTGSAANTVGGTLILFAK